ncbi:MAG: hypothetical protein KJ970_08395 [Candidatus Eisenbacteria bacterium]|uniref:TonB-dependent receptor n=1 Tax=Eiseniibacteriota bacterium TaxID=2212470 RepID=A0A948RZ67_UNCEI|nr:hypothetical protein [Candidatus Eisenbacteria bacterium]MBU1950531.1 hypothetical protein [Candidatus Eisenbacteria bacterium]MBU2690934.1 hypothetical protein [Candidatus Eisenbacteria bacterium]
MIERSLDTVRSLPSITGRVDPARLQRFLPAVLIILLAAIPLHSTQAVSVEGDLEMCLPFSTPEDGEVEFYGGILELRGGDDVCYRSSLNPPDASGRLRAIFWGLPAGSYQWRLLRPGIETGWSAWKIDVAPGTRTRWILQDQGPPILHILNPTAALIGLEEPALYLPGSGIDQLKQLSTFPKRRSVSSWETLELNNPAQREPLSVDLPMAIGRASSGLASLTAPWAPDGWRAARLGRQDTRTGLFGVGRTDSYQRMDGTGRAIWNPQKPFRGDLEIVGRYRSDEDPYPRITADNPRTHSELHEQEIYGNLQLWSAGRSLQSWKLTSSFAGTGKEQDYLLKSFGQNQDHSPHEESASIAWNAGLEKEFPYTKHLDQEGTRGPWRHRLRIQTQYSRNFREISDGFYLEDLESYGRPDGNAATVSDSTEWRGDDPSTMFIDEGHIYENYQLNVTNSWNAGASWESMISKDSRLRADLSLTRHTVRHYEHLDPKQIYRGVEGGGYQSVQRFGYTIDAIDRDASSQLEVPELQTGLLWESAGTGGLWQVSIYGRWFKSNHLGPADWTHLPAADSSSEDFNALLEKPGWAGGIGGSIGHSILINESTVWIRGQEKVNRPPLLALGMDPVFLQRSVYLKQFEAPLGNPHLGAEGETQIEAGLRFPVEKRRIPLLGWLLQKWDGAQPLLMQAALYGSLTRHAWVEKATSVESGSLVYIDDSGKQRTRGIHIDARSSQHLPKTGFWIYASYDLSRMEFKGGGPLSLDGGWYEPDLPIGTERVRETTDTFNTPVAAWAGAGYRPHTLDQTHRFRLALIYKTPMRSRSAWLSPFTDWALGLATRWESGRPYTPIAVNAEALVGPAEITGIGDPHSGRMPHTFRIDLSAVKEWNFQQRELAVRFEILNVTGRRNALRVYRATGEADDDGFLQSQEGQAMIDRNGEGFISTYQTALADPFNYDIPTTFRISVNLSLSRLPSLVSS